MLEENRLENQRIGCSSVRHGSHTSRQEDQSGTIWGPLLNTGDPAGSVGNFWGLGHLSSSSVEVVKAEAISLKDKTHDQSESERPSTVSQSTQTRIINLSRHTCLFLQVYFQELVWVGFINKVLLCFINSIKSPPPLRLDLSHETVPELFSIFFYTDSLFIRYLPSIHDTVSTVSGGREHRGSPGTYLKEGIVQWAQERHQWWQCPPILKRDAREVNDLLTREMRNGRGHRRNRCKMQKRKAQNRKQNKKATNKQTPQVSEGQARRTCPGHDRKERAL